MSFSEETIQRIWEKAQTVLGANSSVWRKDQCGAWIGRQFYGSRNSDYGWEIDHINPDSGDDMSNLRPLQWANNTEKSEGRLTCPVTALGNRNVRK